MQQRILLLVVLFLSAYQLIVAQGLWQDEAVLRENAITDWNNSFIHTSSGATIVLYERGKYASRGLYLHKTNPDGQSAWGEDICLTNSGFQNWFPDMRKDSLGNIFITWNEAHTGEGYILYIAKLDENGQLLWGPLTTNAVPDYIYAEVMVPDNNGGIFMIYGRDIAGQSSNIFIQHLSPTGQMLLPESGLQLTNNALQEDADFASLTSDSGLLIGYHIHNGSAMTLKLMRLLPDYTIAWQNTLSPGSSYTFFSDFAQVDSTEYIITWTENAASTANLYMQKFNLSGQFLFSPNRLLGSSTLSSSIYSSLGNDNQGSLFIGIHKGANMDPMANSLQKYDYNGLPVWPVPVIFSDSITAIFAPIPDNSGGCYVMLKSIRNNDSEFYDFKFQHIDSGGQVLFPGGGVEIVNQVPYENHFKVTYSYTDRFWFYWLERYNDKLGLYFQTRDTNGQLISAPHLTMAESLGGDVSLQGIVTRQNDVLAYWLDSRDYTNSIYTHKIYYRIVQPDGSMNPTVDGTQLTRDISGYYAIKSVYLPNGNTVIIWSIATNGTYYISGQAVDAAGNVLWEPGGRIFASLPAGSSISNLMLTNDNNDIYITWNSLHNSTQQRVFIQKVTDGQPVWDTGGMLIDTGSVDPGLINRPLYLKGRYLVIYEQLGSVGSMYVRAMHFEPDGTISQGWVAGGLVVANFDYHSQYHFACSGAVWDGNLYVFYCYNDYGNLHYYYSVLESDGTVPVSQQILQNDPWDELNLNIDTTDGLAYILRLVPFDMSATRFGYNKLEDMTTHPWGDIAQTVYFYNDFNSIASPSIMGFSNGGYLVNWYNGNIVYGGYVNAQGEYQSPIGGDALIEHCKDTYYTAQNNNEMYIAWNDYKVAGYSYYTSEIRMQKFANLSTVGNSDEAAVEPARLTCYPNPCTSVLQIRVFSPSKGRAELAVYNLKGQKVTSLNDAVVDKGRHTFTWNGKDYHGKQVSSGIYYLRLADRQGVSAAKVLYLK